MDQRVDAGPSPAAPPAPEAPETPEAATRAALAAMPADAVADALIVGGGAAGLTAALYLARFRRRVVVVDAGSSRLQRIPRTHNVLGEADGVPGPALLERFRRHVAGYPVRMETGEVSALRPQPGGGFVAAVGTRQLAARLVLLATGVVDVEPPLPHLQLALRKGLLRYCPVCDGYEALGQRVGIIADGPHGAREAAYLRHFSRRLTLFRLPGTPPWDAATLERLQALGIAAPAAPVDSLRHWDGLLTVRHGTTETDCDTVYAALGLRVRSELAAAAGAACDDKGYVRTDAHQRTSVPGLFAAGDVSRGLNQISVACGEAAIAASAMHLALRAADMAAGPGG